MSIPSASAVDSDSHEIEGILHAISRIAGRIEAELSSAAAEHGLASQQAAVLFSLVRSGPTHMSALSHALECDAGNLSGVIDRLVEARLVTRSASAADRRIRQLTLTAAGRRVATKLEQKLGASRLIEALTGLAAAQRRQLAETLEALLGR